MSNSMQFEWKQYNEEYAKLVDSWIDSYTVNETGIDGGWQEFYDYWMTENESNSGKDQCFIVSLNNTPLAVMYIGVIDTKMVISEYIVAPNRRGNGYGTAILKELLKNKVPLLHAKVSVAEAVIYPNNIASIRAFEKAGFVFVSEHPDGDAWYYEYKYTSN